MNTGASNDSCIIHKNRKKLEKNFNIRIIVVIKFLLKPIYTKNLTLADPKLDLEISYTK